jgi:arylsulfatase A-like enzyme
MVDAMDRGIGRILKRIEQDKSDTIVLFMSDNGGPRGAGADNGALRLGKSTVYEGGIRVAGVVWQPSRLKPGVCEQLVTAYDMLPTLAAACGVPVRTKQPLDGEDFWPAISSGAAPRERRNLLFAVQPDRGPRQHAVRDGAWKLVRIGQAPCDTPVEALFNIDADPHEKNDLLASQPDVAGRLRQLMDAWIKAAPPGEASYSLQPHPGWITPRDWSKMAVE